MIGTLNGETERLLAQGQDAARKGDKASARSLLTQVVERDPHHELAWMWLSGVVEEPEEQQICLENVLVINPQNAKARRGLEFISTKTGIPPHYPPVPNEHNTSPSEYTAPLTANSPLFAELSGQWPSVNSSPSQGDSASEGSEASAAFLAWMQSPAPATSEDGGYGAASPLLPQFDTQESADSQAIGWGSPANQPFNQEQLDWNQPPSQFNVMSLADGVDDRLAQFESGSGSVPPWAESGSQQGDIFGGNAMPFGADSFAPWPGVPSVRVPRLQLRVRRVRPQVRLGQWAYTPIAISLRRLTFPSLTSLPSSPGTYSQTNSHPQTIVTMLARACLRLETSPGALGEEEPHRNG